MNIGRVIRNAVHPLQWRFELRAGHVAQVRAGEQGRARADMGLLLGIGTTPCR